jgi:hypothetical protein
LLFTEFTWKSLISKSKHESQIVSNLFPDVNY